MRMLTRLSLLGLLLTCHCGPGDEAPSSSEPAEDGERELDADAGANDEQVDAARSPARGARDASDGARADAQAPSVARPSSRDSAVDGASSADAARPQAGHDGDAGAGSKVDASTQADGAKGCAGALLCEDFEASGALPEGWMPSAPDCMGEGKAEADGAAVHGGARALRVSSKGGYCNHAFAKVALPPELSRGELWVRFYVRLESAPGNEHVTFVTMQDRVSGKHLRMGFQSGILMWNREKDDATLPELSPTGIGMSVMPKAGTWQCVEFHLAEGRLETFVDGATVPGLTVDGTPTQDVDGQWLRPGPFASDVQDLQLGWESYGSQPMTLWFDDVALGSVRSGC